MKSLDKSAMTPVVEAQLESALRYFGKDMQRQDQNVPK
jgi:hypothetical protein